MQVAPSVRQAAVQGYVCKKKERNCGPSCSCHFCNNSPQSQRETCMNETDFVVNDLLEEKSDDAYVKESDDDVEELRAEEMDKDEELQVLMNFVFRIEDDS